MRGLGRGLCPLHIFFVEFESYSEHHVAVELPVVQAENTAFGRQRGMSMPPGHWIRHWAHLSFSSKILTLKFVHFCTWQAKYSPSVSLLYSRSIRAANRL